MRDFIYKQTHRQLVAGAGKGVVDDCALGPGLMLNDGSNVRGNRERMILIDTCGEGAGVAVSDAEKVLAREDLPRGGGSAEIVAAVQRVLAQVGCALAEMDAIGVASGPGSFTGVRVGMAAAKGFSEAAQVRMIVVSRLQVLAEAVALQDGVVALDAGRGECYAGEIVAGRVAVERLASVDDLCVLAGGREVVVAEEKVASRLTEAAPMLRVRLRALLVDDALTPLLRMLREDSATMVLADANYVRRENDIYKAGNRK